MATIKEELRHIESEIISLERVALNNPGIAGRCLREIDKLKEVENQLRLAKFGVMKNAN